MLGWVLLAVFVGVIVGFALVFGYLELRFQRWRSRERGKFSLERPDVSCGKRELNGVGLQLDSRERRRIVQRELDKLRR